MFACDTFALCLRARQVSDRPQVNSDGLLVVSAGAWLEFVVQASQTCGRAGGQAGRQLFRFNGTSHLEKGESN